MPTKSGTLNRIVSKTMAAGSEHVAKVLKGEETLPEAAGAAVEDLLSGSTSRPSPKAAIRKAVKSKMSAEKKPTAKSDSSRKKAKK
ncbi:MAG: hypothetical protein WBY93_19165 [Candidatus Binatus sp.]